MNATITLNNDITIPQIGLGVFRNPPGDTTFNAVTSALQSGYRHIDTAKIYGNEADVGRAIRSSGIAREDIFVTTKLWNDDQGYDSTLRAFDTSLQALGLEYLDLYLLHWPVPGKRLDSWKALEKLYKDGRIRAIGVSNFLARHIEELLQNCEIPPTINQIELSPYNYRYRQDTVDLCTANQVMTEAYSPLTKARKLNDAPLVAIANTYGVTAAQILIRWAVQKNIVVIPKSTNPERIRQNADVFGFEISEQDMQALDNLNENLVTGWDPTDVQ